MKKTLIINDQHLGIKRQGGTTPQSRLALERYMLKEFAQVLTIPHDNVIILGDLCDARNIAEHVMKQAIDILSGEDCTIVLGNHCVKGIEDHTMSSCEFIGTLGGHRVVKTPQFCGDNLYVIPHLHSQTEYDAAIQEVPDGVILLVHSNIDSPFASSDHSLNLSKEQIADLHKRNVEVISGHEHSGRSYMDNVFILGTQTPSSIADCLSGDKRAMTLESGEVELHTTWWQKVHYVELDWREITDTGKDFVRITGECSVAEYSEVVRAVNDLRKTSDSFVISNKVEVLTEGHDLNKEEVTNFNIIELLMDQIDEEFRENVQSCI